MTAIFQSSIIAQIFWSHDLEVSLTPYEAIFLGILQGVTEFLPISSSGHLVITQHLIDGFKQPGLLFDVMLHVGTLVAVLVYFKKELFSLIGSLSFKTRITPKERENRRLILLILIGTLPTAFIAISFKDTFERLFTSPSTVGLMLIVTGTILFLTKGIKNPYREEGDLKVMDAILIGLVQGIAIIPGISRSGSTIATGIFKKIKPVAAARFSFLLSIPAILGAILLEAKGFTELTLYGIGVYILGALVAGLSGFLAIATLMRILMKGHLSIFSYYCWFLGGLALLFIK